jgi:hypothetical protein
MAAPVVAIIKGGKAMSSVPLEQTIRTLILPSDKNFTSN